MPTAPSSVATLVAEVRALASACGSLEALRAAVTAFKGLDICRTARNTVFADGTPTGTEPCGGIMLIGEAPGATEDAEGIPFCGQSGQLLDTMLATIGLNRREHVYISNTLFWRPPGNRPPTPEEQAVCLPFVERHIALVRPRLLILCGSSATKALLDPKTPIGKLRGRLHTYSNPYLETDARAPVPVPVPVPVAVMFHPSYLLRSPQQKRQAWLDLLRIQGWLEGA